MARDCERMDKQRYHELYGPRIEERYDDPLSFMYHECTGS